MHKHAYIHRYIDTYTCILVPKLKFFEQKFQFTAGSACAARMFGNQVAPHVHSWKLMHCMLNRALQGVKLN